MYKDLTSFFLVSLFCSYAQMFSMEKEFNHQLVSSGQFLLPTPEFGEVMNMVPDRLSDKQKKELAEAEKNKDEFFTSLLNSHILESLYRVCQLADIYTVNFYRRDDTRELFECSLDIAFRNLDERVKDGDVISSDNAAAMLRTAQIILPLLDPIFLRMEHLHNIIKLSAYYQHSFEPIEQMLNHMLKKRQDLLRPSSSSHCQHDVSLSLIAIQYGAERAHNYFIGRESFAGAGLVNDVLNMIGDKIRLPRGAIATFAAKLSKQTGYRFGGQNSSARK
jgi:hypothetical protein